MEKNCAILRQMDGSYIRDKDGEVKALLLEEPPPLTIDLPTPPAFEAMFTTGPLDKLTAQYRRFVKTGRWHPLFDRHGLYEGDALVYQEQAA